MTRDRRIRAVLWDLDGTLTDSVHLVVDTANRVIAAHGGAALDAEVVGRMTGAPLERIFRVAWPDLTSADATAYRDEYRAIYEREAIPATRLHRGARVTLRAIHAAGLLQATVTGKRAADCERILRGLRIRNEIDAYLGGDSVARPKPAPDLALAAAARLGVPPAECVVVGDAPADVEMAHAASTRVIQVSWGYARARLEGADAFVRSWPELRRELLTRAGRRSARPPRRS
ncbi:MAG: HAD-IA family hydrolase [Chloroflexota bacterium]|nr:HAD-IA family hydrolase [Chloroflexota bacterium]MDE3193901.1 HAD-IA family hydrolase [Chloroflexota bacterium]